jgi:hypothetical protein
MNCSRRLLVFLMRRIIIVLVMISNSKDWVVFRILRAIFSLKISKIRTRICFFMKGINILIKMEWLNKKLLILTFLIIIIVVLLLIMNSKNSKRIPSFIPKTTNCTSISTSFRKIYKIMSFLY